MEVSPPDTRVSITLALKQQNLEEFDALFDSITTPGSPEYGRYRSISELTEIIAPPKHLQNFVVHFFATRGCKAESFGEFVAAECDTAVLEDVFNARFHRFRHDQLPGSLHRSVEYPVIPRELHHIVTFVTGISTFPAERKLSIKVPISEDVVTDDWVVPQTIRAFYNIPEGTQGKLKTNSMAVVQFGFMAGFYQSDLDLFNQVTSTPKGSLAYTVGNFGQPPGWLGESTLDIQYIMAVAPGVPTSFWTIDGWMYDFTTLIQSRQSQGLDVPLVFSLSYDWLEADQCNITFSGTSCSQVGGTDKSYVETTSKNFQKIGASGVTLIVASGDAGAATRKNLYCNMTNTPIQPYFPASSPYVTTIGGTMIVNGTPLTGELPPFCQGANTTCAGGGSEVACSIPQALITSGGGFSNVFPA
jgi:subtilase family serine protease